MFSDKKKATIAVVHFSPVTLEQMLTTINRGYTWIFMVYPDFLQLKFRKLAPPKSCKYILSTFSFEKSPIRSDSLCRHRHYSKFSKTEIKLSIALTKIEVGARLTIMPKSRPFSALIFGDGRLIKYSTIAGRRTEFSWYNTSRIRGTE